MPVALVVGGRDAKFRELAERMVGLLPSGRLSVLDGGHALLLENPDDLAQLLCRRPSRESPGEVGDVRAR